jgi:aspartyl-tRNA(Asn)/glutamyl-tRNA(Gln) amidotransferase subunit A
MTSSPVPRPDIHDTLAAIRAGKTTVSREMATSLEIARSKACEHAFLSLDEAAGLAPYDARSPLKGLAVSVKDLYDLHGQVTTAGSRVLADAPAASEDAPAVQALKAAGGVVIGRTNMTEFAFSGIGINPHHGTPANPSDPATPRIPGGSSSGAAVSVATGAVFAGLGSDTGGSIRIPAALCGVVGFKPTACTVPTDGAVPLSHTLDTVCAMTRSVRDAALVHNILSGDHITLKGQPLRGYKLAMAQSVMVDALDATVSRAFERSLSRLRQAGAQIVDLPLVALLDAARVQARGGFSAPELMAWQRVRGIWPERRAQLDPRVAQRIATAEGMSAADYVQLSTERADWIARMEQALQGVDAVISPTLPLVAPPIAQLAPGAENDAEFFRVNALMLRNTSLINLLDGCAISLPCHAVGELPVGMMVWHAGLHDADVLNVAAAIEQCLAS